MGFEFKRRFGFYSGVGKFIDYNGKEYWVYGGLGVGK